VHVLLIYGEGRVEEALLLSATGERLRVLRRGQADTMEFRRHEEAWINESGAVVQIGAASPASVATADTLLDGAATRPQSGFAVDRFGNVLAN
jgi:hypothetical protein